MGPVRKLDAGSAGSLPLGGRLGEDEMKTRSSTRTAGGEEEPRAQNEYLEVLKKRVEEARQRERDRGVFTRMRE